MFLININLNVFTKISEKNMSYKISIIIPIFNGEKSIKRSMDSLINQTFGFKNLEVILVNDNSKDNTKDIITKYSLKYKNCKSINLKINSGYAGKPRNIGIKNATAPYIMFLDCDDEYLFDACEVFYNQIKKENVDLVESLNQYEKVNNQKIYKNSNSLKEDYNINSKIKIKISDYYKLKNVNKLTCYNAIYKKEIITENSIYFPESQYGEDPYFRLKYLLNSKEILILNYYYGILINFNETNENKSLTHTHDLKAFYSSLKGLYSIIDLIKNHPKEKNIKKYIFPSFYEGLLIALLIEISFLNIENAKKKELFNEIYNVEKYANCNISLNQKWATILNDFIMEKKFKSALIITKSMNFVNNKKTLKNMYRKIIRTSVN